MPIHRIMYQEARDSWDIDAAVLAASPRIDDFAAEAARLRERGRSLRDIPAEEILDFFDEAGRTAFVDEAGIAGATAPGGIAYLAPFLGRRNLGQLLRMALQGDVRALDDFVDLESAGKRVIALPRGLVTHWTAGNVPLLGAISVLQGLLTKNVNVVKLPRGNGLALPWIFAGLADAAAGMAGGRPLVGRAIAEALLFVYCEPGDREAQSRLSMESDVRIVWGGESAVGSVLSLPRKSDAEDLCFGPRASLAFIARDSFSAGDLGKLLSRLAFDASVFDQHGCNSPRTVFVERGGSVAPRDFARGLAEAMNRVLLRIPKGPIGAEEAFAVASIRAEYAARGEVFASRGTEWTVIYSEDGEPVRACGSRVVFVRPVDDAHEVSEAVDSGTQTIGLSLGEPMRTEFARAAARRGAARITKIGAMSFYDYPWDGQFPMERLVRWASLE